MASKPPDQEEALLPPPSRQPASSVHLLPVEENPWRNISYILTTLQLMMTLLDLFMESGDIPAIHYAITTLQFCPAIALTIYQAIRINGIWKYREDNSATGVDLHIRKPIFFLVLALLLQLYVLVVSAMWFNIANDLNTTHLEWSVFGIVLIFSSINPLTFTFVSKVVEGSSDAGSNSRMGPGAAAVSVFTQHFMKEKLLFVLGALVACGQAFLSTYQGAIINDLTKLVTKISVDPKTGEIKHDVPYSEVEMKGALLVAVWASANFARFLFDILSALMFSRLEVWLRGEVFEKAMIYTQNQQYMDGNIPDPAAEFGARYASDVTGVISLYSTLLRGVIVNILLIGTNFIFLVVFSWEVGVATLCLLVMAITSGPTDLAANASRSSQKNATEGLGVLSQGIRSNHSYLDVTTESLCQKHMEDIMVPMQKSLFEQLFYTNSVDTYINFFSSFLTVVVVITMTSNVYDGSMNSSDFLGVFFVFKELQKPAMKMSGVLKALIKRSANLERLNGTIFPVSEGES